MQSSELANDLIGFFNGIIDATCRAAREASFIRSSAISQVQKLNRQVKSVLQELKGHYFVTPVEELKYF